MKECAMRHSESCEMQGAMKVCSHDYQTREALNEIVVRCVQETRL